jgi:hypothetical protein
MQHGPMKVTSHARTWAAVLAVTAAMAGLSAARADEAQAKSLLKGMSDYLAAQNTISLEYDSNLEIVTRQNQKLGLATHIEDLVDRRLPPSLGTLVVAAQKADTPSANGQR